MWGEDDQAMATGFGIRKADGVMCRPVGESLLQGTGGDGWGGSKKRKIGLQKGPGKEVGSGEGLFFVVIFSIYQ
jgi:hypothetical protein